MNSKNNILQTVHFLRTNQELVIYTNKPKVTAKELEDLAVFLEDEYHTECLDYPYTSSGFNKNAAIWAAKILYFATQFLAHRNDEPKNIQKYFPSYEGDINPSTLLSADITLRFLPFVINELKAIDFDDWLINILLELITPFAYSTIGNDFELKFDTDLLKKASQDQCFKTLFSNRIIEKKDTLWANHTLYKDEINVHLGMHKPIFWKHLEFTND